MQIKDRIEEKGKRRKEGKGGRKKQRKENEKCVTYVH